MAQKIAHQYKTHCPSAIKASADGGKEVAASEEECVYGDVLATLMREVDIRDRYLAERLNRSAKESLQDLICDPLAVCLCVR